MIVGRALALLCALVLQVGPTLAACTNEVEPNETPEAANALPGPDFCIKGSAEGGDQDWLAFDLAKPVLWHLTLEAPPGPSGAVVLARVPSDGGAPVSTWTGTLDLTTGLLTSPEVMLGPGRWAVQIGASADKLRWRLHGQAAALPDATAPTAPIDGFQTLVTGTGDAVELPWMVSAEGAAQPWTLSLQGPIDAAAGLEVDDPSGAVVFDEPGSGAAHDVKRIDLGLAAGQYRLRVKGLDAGAVALLSASPDPAGTPDYQREPDNTIDHGHALTLGEALTARLYGSGGGSDTDYFTFDVPDPTPSGPAPRLEIDLDAPVGKEIDAALTDATGADISEVYIGPGGKSHLGPLALPPGHYGLRLNGSLPPEDSYSVTLVSAPPLPPGTEAEPNDRPAYATVLKVGGTVSGDGSDHTVDMIAVTAPPGDLHWWTIRAHGEGGISMEVRNGQGLVLNQTRRGDAGEATLARLPLAPGRNLITLHAEGAWSLSVDPAPPPASGEEREPNDTPMTATVLTPDAPMRFWLDHLEDTDSFALPVTSAQRLVLQVSVPAAVQASGDLDIPAQASPMPLDFAPDPADPGKALARVEAILPVGTAVLTLKGADLSPDAGQITVTLAPPFAAPEPGGAGVMTPDPSLLAANWPQMQRLQGQVRLTPPPGATGSARLSPWVSDGEWRFLGLPATVDLSGGPITLPWRLEAPPWLDAGEAATLAVALTEPASGATLAIATAKVQTAEGVTAADPAPYAPLPDPLLGALDAARSDFGGAIDPSNAAGLTDGQLDGTETDLPAGTGVTITLPGDQPLSVLGLVLTPPASGEVGARLRHLRIEAAGADGLWSPVIEAEIDPSARAQPVLFDKPLPARQIRLIPLDTWGGVAGTVARLSELSVLVPPEALPAPFDLARVELGGHLIRATVASWPLVGEAAGWPGQPVQFKGDPGTQAFFVMGFLDGRAAAVSDIGVANDPSVSADAQPVSMQVDAAIEGPLGPWTPVGRVLIDPSTGQGALHLASPVWARDLRFTVESPDASQAYLPGQVTVTEDRAAEGGGSILGEWGAATQSAVWERRTATEATGGLGGGTSPGAAVALDAGAAAAGQVSAQALHRYYRLAPPEGALTLTLKRDDDGAALTLTDAAGDSVSLAPTEGGVEADVTGRKGPFLLDVFKARDSIAVLWDTSGSVATFSSAIFSAVQDLTDSLSHGDLAMNFVPFRAANRSGATPLLDHFATDAGTAWSTLNAYSDPDSDSDSEAALIVASNALAQEPGRHAIVLITDASFTSQLTESSWAAIGAANPRIYALRVPSGTRDAAARGQAAMMQDWADFNHGQHRIFADPSDARAAFRALAADLRRPVPYRLSWSFTTTPPPPALLTVQAGQASGQGTASDLGGRAIEVILDASGSMLQKVGGKRKIDLAKAILADLTAKDLPKGTDFALRVFGIGGKGSCEGKDVVPLAPLDTGVAAQAIATIKAENGAKTAIGASLRDAGADLASAAGARLIVLITDGEETCGGDPASEIAALRGQGFDLRLNIVGFNLDDPALKDQFTAWATAGGGAFFDASDGASLGAAVKSAVAVEFHLIAADGSVVASGTVDGPPVQAPAGAYQLQVGDGTLPPQPVTLQPGQSTTLTLPVD